MEDIDRIENIDSAQFRSLFGTTEKKIDLPTKAKTELKKEMAELNAEKQIEESSLTMGHALLIMARRSSRMRKIRKDPDLRMMLSKKDP